MNLICICVLLTASPCANSAESRTPGPQIIQAVSTTPDAAMKSATNAIASNTPSPRLDGEKQATTSVGSNRDKAPQSPSFPVSGGTLLLIWLAVYVTWRVRHDEQAV